jgi:CheY-like chemotaxis protein/HPt (histidine-containing phosphotransfer) domain-containing protein
MAPATEAVPEALTVPASQAVGTFGRLLIVEDNAINQAVAKGPAARLGYACDVAGNGIEALAALERRHYDAVLMDCQMPDMDGFEATAEIRRREGSAKHVPIIAMTASALVEDRERCLAAGMDDYLSKPVKGPELGRLLGRWLRAGAGEDDSAGRPEDATGIGSDALDPTRLEELRALDPDGSAGLLPGLFDAFLGQATSDLSELAEAAVAADGGAIARIAHSLKGAAQNLGAGAVAGRCTELEVAVHAGRLTEVPAILGGLEAELERVRLVVTAAS